MIFFRGHEMNDLIGQLFAVAQEKDCKNRNHQDSGESRRGSLFDFCQSVLDVRAMAFEEKAHLIGALISPTEVVRNLSGRNLVRQRRDCRENPACVLAKFRNEAVGKQHDHDDDREIGFHDVRASEVFEKQRMTLEEPDNRINQVSEEDCERKNYENRPRDVDNRKHKSEGKDRQSDFRCPRIKHLPFLPDRFRPSRAQSFWLSSFCLMAASAFSSDERVLSTATLRTMPPLKPVRPACWEPFMVMR